MTELDPSVLFMDPLDALRVARVVNWLEKVTDEQYRGWPDES